MRRILPKSLIALAQVCPTPLYVVGGSVRDFLANLTPNTPSRDLDICAAIDAQTFASLATENGFTVRALFKNTGTIKLQDQNKNDFEFSCFRSDKYVRGTHVPVETCFTDDITLDARRRDFTINAIYYDIRADKFVDPLDGITAIKEKRLTTVAPAKKVFSEDGLRLMRLARFTATLGFTPDNDCLLGATHNAALIKDISPERIFTELTAILQADEKYGIQNGHYQGLLLLDQTRVLDYILPELTLGRGIPGRPDFHNYDVLGHSLRAVYYAPKHLRLAALLHDVGKPFCYHRDGNTHAHAVEGEPIARKILHRLKAPSRTIDRVCDLVAWHMYDFNCQTGENKLRRFFVEHYDLLDDLLLVKQADFSACKDNVSIAPTRKKWLALLSQMRQERAPLCLKELALNGKDLLNVGIPPARVSPLLKKALLHAAINPSDNQKDKLIAIVLREENI